MPNYYGCDCGAIDCQTCGPAQGYPYRKHYPKGSLSAEDCDILNEEYRAEQAAADEEAELMYRRMLEDEEAGVEKPAVEHDLF